MKKVLALFVVALLVGCGSSKQISSDADEMADDVNKAAKDKKEEEMAEAEEDADAAAEEAMKVDVVDTAVKEGNFTTLVAAINAAELADDLKGPGPFTVFAPTDEAFKKLPAGTVEELLKPDNKEKLVAILQYHVVPGKVMAADVETMEAETLGGAKAKVNVGEEGAVTYAGANVTATDIEAKNGVIHVIDTVVMPPSDGGDAGDEGAEKEGAKTGDETAQK